MHTLAYPTHEHARAKVARHRTHYHRLHVNGFSNPIHNVLVVISPDGDAAVEINRSELVAVMLNRLLMIYNTFTIASFICVKIFAYNHNRTRISFQFL